MQALTDRRLRAVALGFGLLGPIGWYAFSLLFWNTPGQDFMVFHTAAAVAGRGDFALLLDAHRFTDELNRTHAAWLPQKLEFHPWVYPPPMLLLAMPFGALSYGLAYALFSGGTLLFMCAALRLWARGADYLWLLAGVLICPTTAYAIGSGQNAFLNAGLLCAGVWLLPRRPFLAGLVLGVLGLKPQLALMLPVAVIAGRYWPAVAGGALCAVLLCLLSLPIGGIALWQDWAKLMLSGDAAFHTWIDAGRIYGQSVYADLRVLGFGHGIATSGQWLAALVSAVAVWRAFSRPLAPHLRLAVLLVASILAAPHVSPYDAVCVGIAAMLVILPGRHGALPGRVLLAAVCAWLTTLINPAFLLPPGVITPLVLAAFTFICGAAPDQALDQPSARAASSAK